MQRQTMIKSVNVILDDFNRAVDKFMIIEKLYVDEKYP